MTGPTRTVRLLYGKTGMELRVPASAAVLAGQNVPALGRPEQAVVEALNHPIGVPPLAALIAAKSPRTVAITVSDITRPVPNRLFLPPMLKALNAAGVADRQIVVIIGTGMHRPSTPAERETLLGAEVLSRVEVIDHTADRPETLVPVPAPSTSLGTGRSTSPGASAPPISVNRRFAEADFRIVTGYIEPHFMAGFSGGRKGVCPALVDLATVQRFHGYRTLADPRADNGVLDGNPCHEIALTVARAVGVDLLFNVAITRDRRIAGIYCGHLEQAHLAGCRDVAAWTSCRIDGHFDLVVTNGGGYPLDATFYQTVKGMCGALPALRGGAADSAPGAGRPSGAGERPPTTLLIVSDCSEKLGSKAYTELMLAYDNDWRRFLSDIAASDATRLDQWEFQMQARVLARIGRENLRLVSEGIPADMQRHVAVNPVAGEGPAAARAQRCLDEFVAEHPAARVAVIPDGPYTMLVRAAD